MNARQATQLVEAAGNALLHIPEGAPQYLIDAVYQVNLTGEEFTLVLPGGLRAILSPGTDLEPLGKILQSEEFRRALEEVTANQANL